MGSELMGIVSSRDVDFLAEEDSGKTLSEVMTPKEDLIVGNSDLSLSECNKIMQDGRKGTASETTLASVANTSPLFLPLSVSRCLSLSLLVPGERRLGVF